MATGASNTAPDISKIYQSWDRSHNNDYNNKSSPFLMNCIIRYIDVIYNLSFDLRIMSNYYRVSMTEEGSLGENCLQYLCQTVYDPTNFSIRDNLINSRDSTMSSDGNGENGQHW